MILWLHPFSGLSGDMLLGALVDLGAPVEAARAAVASTGLEGWALEVARRDAGGIVATHVEVRVDDDAAEREASELIALVERARPERVAALAGDALRRLAEVEAALHGVDAASVHLHELGGLDTVVDVVGALAALDALGVDTVACAPPALGTGTLQTRHGRLPAPAPATLALLEGASVTGSSDRGETVTPTGAALLRALGTSFGPMPPLVVEASGYGAGRRRFPGHPNVLPAVLGRPVGVGRTQVLVETNLDDVTGEVLAHVVDRALARGAADAWVAPVVMKKGRPAHVLHVLVDVEHLASVEAVIFEETRTLGVRRVAVEKVEAERATFTVEVDGVPVRVKHGPRGVKAEHDDVVRAAQRLGLSSRDVAQRALDADASGESPADASREPPRT